MKTIVIVAAALTIAMAAAEQTAAQEARGEEIAAAQEKKADETRPYEPGKAERIFLALKHQFIDTPSGLYPLVGSVYSGGGFAMGGGYRRFAGDRTFWDLKGLMSIRANK